MLWVNCEKMCVFYAKKRDFLMFFVSKKKVARACARAPTRTNKKRAQTRARAREIEKKIRIFSDFTSGCND